MRDEKQMHGISHYYEFTNGQSDIVWIDRSEIPDLRKAKSNEQAIQQWSRSTDPDRNWSTEPVSHKAGLQATQAEHGLKGHGVNTHYPAAQFVGGDKLQQGICQGILPDKAEANEQHQDQG